MINILLIEDEEILGQLVKDALEFRMDAAVSWMKDGKAALEAVNAGIPDICILDVMIPEIDGFRLASMIRKVSSSVPIIFLTARSSTADVIRGFEAGGNDYLKKPFSIEELVVRVHNLLRASVQNNHEDPAPLTFGNLRLIPDSQVLYLSDNKYKLTGRECDIMKELIIHKNKVVDKKKLQMQLWGTDSFFNSRTIDVYITKLRKYLSDDPSLSIINVRGYGYKLVQD